MNAYQVKPLSPHAEIAVDVPASKSLLNRALVLAAFGKGEIFLSCGNFSEDTCAMLSCLSALGIGIRREEGGVRIVGCGGNVPNKCAELDIRSAGTAARFLPAVLAFLGGDYTFRASAQMQKRPMELLGVLSEAGAAIEYLGKPGHLPFRMRSDGIRAEELTVDTAMSTQYASGLLLAAAVSGPLRIRLTGPRTQGSYIGMTMRLAEQFGAACSRSGDTLSILPSAHSPASLEIEADLSGACYFYALSLLLSARVLVRKIHGDTLQGDKKFLSLLQDRGVRFTDSEEGLIADGRGIRNFEGFCTDMRDFSDQALTVAALAPFASTPTRITGIGHIRGQECDRIRAAVENLTALGVPATQSEDGFCVTPSPVRRAVIRTYHDHRVAMAFALVGLKTGEVLIDDPACCQKTFENYFSVLEELGT